MMVPNSERVKKLSKENPISLPTQIPARKSQHTYLLLKYSSRDSLYMSIHVFKMSALPKWEVSALACSLVLSRRWLYPCFLFTSALRCPGEEVQGGGDIPGLEG